ncbi:MAG: ATP-dependent RNA helicase HrpA [Phycisphaerales bacterium]|nr:MAG: ATP-dependent RNA helicase HrpA [Phycisphaerales bacterium]
MRHEHDGLAERREDLAQLVLQLAPDQRIERPQRLIEQQRLRVQKQRSHQTDALTLPAGELAGVAIEPVFREVREGGELVEASRDLRLGPSALRARVASGERGVLPRRHVREEPPGLDDVAEAVAHAPQARAGQRLAIEQHPPLVGEDQPDQKAEERALAAPARADQGRGPPGLGPQADPVDRRHAVVPLDDRVGLQHRPQHSGPAIYHPPVRERAPDLRALRASLASCDSSDRARLRTRLNRAHERGDTSERTMRPLAEAIERSVQRRARREAGIPKKITYPPDLPVSERREEIAEAIRNHQVVVLCGETGSGKTTQLPKICLEIGRGRAGVIAHTQPRRIAARSVAQRIADELNVPFGTVVGSKVRFGDQTSEQTAVKLMTDGILLAEIQTDRRLRRYDTIIIDEAHERSLNIDFLMGYLRQLLPKRPDLKLIITSATIDPQRFADHFGGAPVLMVEGRMYPVETRYRPLMTEAPDEDDRSLQDAVLEALQELRRDAPWDVLVFMPGEREIRETAKHLEEHAGVLGRGLEILPLYARLTTAEQQRVFKQGRGQRVVIATNVAETSLTVPGIRAVIDCGTARISRYNPRTKVQQLPIEPISQASADQRKGRCGRVGPGVCVRLYAEEDFDAREAFTPPEIVRTDLASVILRMRALRLGDPESFPFVEPPEGRLIRDGYDTLLELGAIDERRELTAIGERLAKLPIDPRVGRMLLAGAEAGCVTEVLIIASALAAQDPRDRPMDQRHEADAAHEKFASEDSDFIALLKIWRFYHDLKEKLGSSQLKKACKANFISYVRMREWIETHRQLRGLIVEMGFEPNRKETDPSVVHEALLAGLLSNVGTLDKAGEYKGPRGLRFHIFPGSGVFKTRPKWLVAEELVRTSKLYARAVAKIEPAAIERVGAHLVKRTHAEPHWDARAGRVYCYEKVSLFGLDLVERRRVEFGPIDPASAREMFIHYALVEGESNIDAGFKRHNDRLIEELRREEAKLRAPGSLYVPDALLAFYEQRLPPDVYDVQRLNRFRKLAEREGDEKNRRLLYATRDDLVGERHTLARPELYPDEIESLGQRLSLDYAIDPDGERDGVTAVVPLTQLGAIDPHRAEWLVPGMLESKIAELVRLLPKKFRRAIGPAPEFAKEFVRTIEFGRGSLLEQVAAAVAARAHEPLPRDALDEKALPLHLRMAFSVVDERGREIGRGRDVRNLQKTLKTDVRGSLRRLADSPYNRDDLRTWDFDELPERVEAHRAGATITAFPSLVCEGDKVALRLLENPAAAERETRAGLRRLFYYQVRKEIDALVAHMPGVDKLALRYAPLGSSASIRRTIAELAVERAFLEGREPVRDGAAFERRLHEAYPDLSPHVHEVFRTVEGIVQELHKVTLALEGPLPPPWAGSVADIRAQLAFLMPEGFLVRTPQAWLRHFPRYLKAVSSRLERLRRGGLAKDQKAMAELGLWVGHYAERARAHALQSIEDPELDRMRWMLEELRVSLFAQDLGTAMPVSGKRMGEQLAKVR